MSNPQSNAHEIDLFEIRRVDKKDIPAFTLAKNEKCAECPQYVTSDGITVCAHQMVENYHSHAVKKICRRCWYNFKVRAKYTGQSAPWRILAFVTK